MFPFMRVGVISHLQQDDSHLTVSIKQKARTRNCVSRLSLTGHEFTRPSRG